MSSYVTRRGRKTKRINYCDPNTESECNSDTDDGFEIYKPPPLKRQKINSRKSKPTKQKTIKQIPKKRKIRKHRNKSQSKSITIPPLPNYKKTKRKIRKVKQKKSKKQKQNKIKSVKTKTKNKKKKSQKKTIKTSITSNIPSNKVNILIDGYFRKQFNSNHNKRILNILPEVISSQISLYRNNLMYFTINFIWTHKHRCNCSSANYCSVLKRNRGSYLFKREPNNSYDSNAIAIYGNNDRKHVGYINREYASILAPLIDINVIKLASLGGIIGKPCCELVQIIHLDKTYQLSDEVMDLLEKKHYQSIKRLGPSE